MRERDGNKKGEIRKERARAREHEGERNSRRDSWRERGIYRICV